MPELMCYVVMHDDRNLVAVLPIVDATETLRLQIVSQSAAEGLCIRTVPHRDAMAKIASGEWAFMREAE